MKASPGDYAEAFYYPLLLQLYAAWQILPTALVAIGISALLFAHDGLAVPLGLMGFTLIPLAFIVSRPAIGDRYVATGLTGICILTTLGALGATTWGMGYVWQSFAIAGFSWYGLLIYYTPIRRGIWQWLMPAVMVHMAAVVVQGLPALGGVAHRAPGLTENVNQAAGLLDIGIVTALLIGLHGTLVWLPILGLLLTGTRLAFWLLVGVLVLMFLTKAVPRRTLAIVAAGIVICSVATWPLAQTQRVYFQGSTAMVTELSAEIGARLPLATPDVAMGALSPGGSIAHELSLQRESFLVGLLPQGYAGDYGIHSTFTRLYYELGVIGLVCAAVAVGRGLWKGRGATRWLLLLFLGLSTLDYYMVMPPFLLLWYLALGQVAHRRLAPHPPSCASAMQDVIS